MKAGGVVKFTLQDLRACDSPTISMKEAAGVLNVDPRTVSAGIKNGTIPAIEIGRRKVIPREKFLRLFEVIDD